MSVCFVFVCQAGRLEVDALILALSLRRFATGDFELVGAVPTPSSIWGTPRPELVEQLGRLGVRVVSIGNHIDIDYGIGNKVSCLAIPTAKEKLVFVDSDMICMRTFDGGAEFAKAFNAKPADHMTFGRDPEQWRLAYASVGLDPPSMRMTATVSGTTMPPYYNAGLVAVASDAGLGAAWLDACLAIDANPKVLNKRPWLDQIALPVAVTMLGLEVGLLTERHNYPAHERRIDDADPPVFCHYHAPKNLARSRHAANVLRSLADEHPIAWELMREERAWAPVARRLRSPRTPRNGPVAGVRKARDVTARAIDRWHERRTPRGTRARNAIITGLPRSGTSLLCALLNEIPDVVCLNEVFREPSTFRAYRRTRAAIVSGRPVPNKLSSSGSIATDTLGQSNRVERRVVRVGRDDFVLAHKLTLPYLNRLEQLCAAGLGVWVMVRHPVFTIASWKRSPPHFGIAQIDPPGPQLTHIPLVSTDPDARRIAIWNHYARAIDRLRDRVEIVRYEDLVADPHGVIGRFCSAFDLRVPEHLPELSNRNRAENLDPTLVDLVRRQTELERFGYA